jgi:hypothetical protein
MIEPRHRGAAVRKTAAHRVQQGHLSHLAARPGVGALRALLAICRLYAVRRCATCQSVLDSSEFGFGAGAEIRTPDPRFKSSPRTPPDASSSLLLNSILRISPPRGTPRLLRLAIRIGYTSTAGHDQGLKLIQRGVSCQARASDALSRTLVKPCSPVTCSLLACPPVLARPWPCVLPLTSRFRLDPGMRDPAVIRRRSRSAHGGEHRISPSHSSGPPQGLILRYQTSG